MTETETNRVLRNKNPNMPCRQPRAIRKSKLRMRYKDERLTNEIKRTKEKLEILLEIQAERTG
jgi:hypothetical protein